LKGSATFFRINLLRHFSIHLFLNGGSSILDTSSTFDWGFSFHFIVYNSATQSSLEKCLVWKNIPLKIRLLEKVAEPYIHRHKGYLRFKAYLKQHLMLNMTDNVLVLSMESIFQTKIFWKLNI